MRKCVAVVLAAWTAVFLCACKPPSDQTAAVRGCLFRLDAAIEGKEPEGVLASYTAGTIQHYDEIVKMAYGYTKEQLLLRPEADAFEVLTVRHLAAKKKLKFADGKEYISAVVKEGWWLHGDTSNWAQAVGEIRVSGETAYGTVLGSLDDKGKVTELRFVKEGGEWKLDEVSAREYISAWVKYQVRRSGKSKEVFMPELLETYTGTPVSRARIWQPMKPAGGESGG